MILNTPFVTAWEAIRIRKQQLTDKYNQNENKNHKPQIYRVHEKGPVYHKK